MSPVNDVKPGWVNIARHLQASVTGNNGYAIVTLKVMVVKGDPVFWFKAEVKPIQPMAITGIEVTAPLLGLLATMADDE